MNKQRLYHQVYSITCFCHDIHISISNWCQALINISYIVLSSTPEVFSVLLPNRLQFPGQEWDVEVTINLRRIQPWEYAKRATLIPVQFWGWMLMSPAAPLLWYWSYVEDFPCRSSDRDEGIDSSIIVNFSQNSWSSRSAQAFLECIIWYAHTKLITDAYKEWQLILGNRVPQMQRFTACFLHILCSLIFSLPPNKPPSHLLPLYFWRTIKECFASV